MSLINEALKRAEAEKRKRTSSLPVGTAMSAVRPKRPPRRVGNVMLFLAAVCLVAIGAGAWAVLDSGAPRHIPAAAVADTPVKAPQQTPAPPRTAPPPADEQPEPQPQPTEADLIVAKTVDSLKYYTPPAGWRSPKATPAPKPVVKIQPDDFKLSAIMRGPNGATAIINGRFVQVGSIVNGAKVTEIARHTVQLEFRGRTFTIQM